MGYDAGYIDGFFHDDGWKCEEINYSSYCGRGRKGFSSDDSVCWACELC